MLHFEIFFIQVCVVVGLPLILWWLFQLGRFFPLAIIQIFTGIALGPSVFGKVAPDTFKLLFGPDLRTGIGTLSHVAIVLFVFLAGCEADRQIIRKSASTVLRIGLIGVLVPWILGGFAAWAIVIFAAPDKLPGIVGNGGVAFYSIAFGLCMAVTALPVLVIVLREIGFIQKPIGSIAIAIGGVDDVLLWLSLAVLLPFAAKTGDLNMSVVLAVAGGVATFAFVKYIVAPLIEKLLREEAPERILMSTMIVALFFSAFVTELTGLHAVLGAFLTGLLMPDKVRHIAESRFDTPVSLLLLPFFFLSTGLKIDFSLHDATIWQIVAIALVVCVGGKFVGVSIPTYLSGQSGPFSITLGLLMQCKGLMEIVVVTVLFEAKVIGIATFTALILTALISTALTAPLARLCQRVFGDAATATREEKQVEVVVTVEPAAAPAPGPQPASAGPVLVFDQDIGAVPLPKADVQIGRHSEDDIRIDDVRVSRHHARLTALGDGRYELYNQTAVRSEPNPILVNGVEKERTVLSDGDVVTLGGTNFKFREKAA